MKLALILTAALGAAPAAPPQSAGERIVVPQGTTFTCAAVGGCYVANEQGVGEFMREIAEQLRARGCRRDNNSI